MVVVATMIPQQERDRFILTVADAHAAGQEQRAVIGYAKLLAGLAHAQQLRGQGEPYGAELVDWWQRAVETYRERYPVPDEETPAAP